MEKVILTSEGYALSLAVFESADAKAAVQVVHGMEEHKERYYAFAEYLAEKGFTVVVSDLRGHGEDAPLLSHIADDDGETLLIQDQKAIADYIGERFPGLPVILFGHSMGTIISRVLMQEDARWLAVALSGYVNPNPASGVAVKMGNVVRKMKGPKGYSGMLTKLALGPYVKSVPDRKTDLDWLSYNEDNIMKYIDDPLCGKEFTVGSYQALFRLLDKMGKAGEYKAVKADMPILLIAGADDPCTGGEKGRAASKEVLEKAGYADVRVITYDHMRHEILNETEKDKVYEDLKSFFEDVTE